MEQGSSLLEMLVCVALLVLSFAIAIPGAAPWLDSRKLYESTEELRLALEQSYVTALSFREPVTITFQQDGGVNGVRGATTVFEFPAKAGVTRTLKEVGQQTLVFHPSGSATPGTVLITSKSRACSLILSLRGRIRRAC
jgi:Tfp pilus assembly protein FimT